MTPNTLLLAKTSLQIDAMFADCGVGNPDHIRLCDLAYHGELAEHHPTVAGVVTWLPTADTPQVLRDRWATP